MLQTKDIIIILCDDVANSIDSLYEIDRKTLYIWSSNVFAF